MFTTEWELQVYEQIRQYFNFAVGNCYDKLKERWIREAFRTTGLFDHFNTVFTRYNFHGTHICKSSNIFNVEFFDDHIWVHYGYLFPDSAGHDFFRFCINLRDGIPTDIECNYDYDMFVEGTVKIPLKNGKPHGVKANKYTVPINGIHHTYYLSYYSNGVLQNTINAGSQVDGINFTLPDTSLHLNICKSCPHLDKISEKCKEDNMSKVWCNKICWFFDKKYMLDELSGIEPCPYKDEHLQLCESEIDDRVSRMIPVCNADDYL